MLRGICLPKVFWKFYGSITEAAEAPETIFKNVEELAAQLLPP